MVAVVTPSMTAPAGHRAPRSLASPWRLLAVGTAVAVTFNAVHPIVDIDLYWHVRLGNEIIATHNIQEAGHDFAYSLPGRGWVTTQWLSETALATLYNIGGFAAIAVMRVVLSAALLGVLAWQLLRRRYTIWAPLVFAVTALIASSYFQARPQLFSLFFGVWLAVVVSDELSGVRRHSTLIVAAVTWVWANVHGMWVLVPACYGLLALGRLAEARLKDYRSALRPGAVAIVALAAASLTPVGPRLLLSPFQFAAATPQIKEWQPTNFHNGVTLAFALLVVAAIAGWVHDNNRVALSEMLYVGGITAFAMYSLRDVPVAAILLAPVILRRLESAFPHPDRVGSERERRAVLGLTVLLVLVGAAAVWVHSMKTPVLSPTLPRSLAAEIAADPGPHRVLDDYNASGATILWGGPSTKVAIDGRADRYGAQFISDYSQLMLTMGDWQQQLAALDPNYALLRSDVPLVRELVAEGWTVRDTEGPWVLLQRANPATANLVTRS